MSKRDDRRALTRARDDLELGVAQARDLIETAAFAIAHAGDDPLPAGPISGTLSAALARLAAIEQAARTIADLADRPEEPPLTLIPIDGTRH